MLVETEIGAPVPHAVIDVQSGQLYGTQTFMTQSTTDSAGAFTLTGLPAGALFLTITAPGFVTRQTLINVTGSRPGLTLDIIADAAPFSLDFYRQFARNELEANLQPIRPWTIAPSVHLETTTQDTGETIAPSVLIGLERVATNSVPELSGGRFSVAAVEIGGATRDSQIGWIEVKFVHDPSLLGSPSGIEAGAALVAGRSTVGGNVGSVQLLYSPTFDAEGLYNPYHCESLTVGTFDHEIVHAMGFYHTTNTFVDFLSGAGCPGNGRPPNVQFHAAVMYSRPPGNVDPDKDNSVFYLSAVDTRRIR